MEHMATCRLMSEKEISEIDFDYCSSYSIKIPTNTSTDSQPILKDYEWTDICPQAFSKLHRIFGIDPNEYMMTVRNYETMQQLQSMKKANTLLMNIMLDKKYMARILSKSDWKKAVETLPFMYRHQQKHRNALHVLVLGFHIFKPSGGQKVRFVVIENFMYTDLDIHKYFHITTNNQGNIISKNSTEEDLNIAFYLEPSMRNQLLAQIKKDCEHLACIGIQDYSLLVAMHVCATPFDDVVKTERSDAGNKETSNRDGSPPSDLDGNRNSDCDVSQFTSPLKERRRLFSGMPARAVDPRRMEKGGVGQGNNVILFIGIVDITQQYSLYKRVENMFRSFQSERESRVKTYSKHFQGLVETFFPEDSS